MGVVASSGKITITDIETDLSNFHDPDTGITVDGCTYYEFDNGSEKFRTVIFDASIQLEIQGTLEIDSNTDHVIIPHTAGNFLWLRILNSGVLKLKDEAVSEDGTESDVFQKIAIRAAAKTDNHWSPSQGIIIENGGGLEMAGGGLWCNSHLNFNGTNAYLKVTKPSLMRLGKAFNDGYNMLRVDATSANIETDGLIFVESSNGFETSDPLVADNYSPRFCKEGLLIYGEKEFVGYNPVGNSMDFAYISTGSFYKVYGYADKPVTASVHFDHTSASGGGWVEIRKKLELTLIDDATSSSIEDGSVYFKDTDNGNRFNKLKDYTEDIVYNAQTDSAGLASFDVLLANQQTGAGEVVEGKNSAPRAVDYRTKNNSEDYKLDISAYAYGFNLKKITDVDFRSLDETLVMSTNLLVDASISESDASLVEAYPFSIDLVGDTLNIVGDGSTLQTVTAQQLYDKVALYMQNNFDSNDIRLSINGDVIDAASNNINIVLDYITFKGSISLDASKSLTLNNGSSIGGGVIDASGDSFVTFDSIDSWKVYPTEADRDSNTNILEEGTGTYRFVFVGEQSIYARVVKDGVTFLVEILVSEAGETVYSLSTEALLQTLPSALDIADAVLSESVSDHKAVDGSVAKALETINDGVKNASIFVPHEEDI